MLIDEMEAIRSLYNLTRPGYSPEPDIETLARYMALIYFDGAIIKTIGAKHSLDDPIVQALLKLYYLDGDKKISETLDIFKKMVENSKRYEQILDQMLRSGEINKLRGMMPATPLFVKRGSGSDYMIVEKLEALYGKLARVMLNLGNEKRGRGQKYAEEIEEIEEEIRNLQGLQGKVLSLVEDIQQLCAKRGRLSISTYLHECATYIYDEFREKVDKPFRKIVDNINKIINVNKSSGLKGSLDETINAIEEFEQMILSTIIASDEICLSSRLHKDRHMTSYSYDDIMALLLGMPMPHPVFHSEPGNGCSLVFNEVEISHGKIKLKSELKGEIPGNANRVDVLSNVPFKHYEVP
jgi:predicted HicB family RNase H-like nuclease